MIFVSIGFALLIGIIFILSGQLLKRNPLRTLMPFMGIGPLAQ